MIVGLPVGFSPDVGSLMTASDVVVSVPVTLPLASLTVFVLLPIGTVTGADKVGLPTGTGALTDSNSDMNRSSLSNDSFDVQSDSVAEPVFTFSLKVQVVPVLV